MTNLFESAGLEAPPVDLTRCAGCGRVFGACDRRAGHFNHPIGSVCSCGVPVTTCQWCVAVSAPRCKPELHAFEAARASGSRRASNMTSERTTT